MVKITEQQVGQAEAKAAEKERERDEVAKQLEQSPYSEVAARTLAEASPLAAQLRASAREMRVAYEAQVAAEQAAADRGQLEKAAAREIRAAEQAVKASSNALAEAAVEAQKALVRLVEATAGHREVIAAHADALAGKGLDLSGEGPGGQRTVLDEPKLRVGGAVYEQVDPGAVAAWLLRRVAEARLSHQHYLVGVLMGAAVTVEQRAAEVVAAVPEPDRVEWPALPRLVNAFQTMLAAK